MNMEEFILIGGFAYRYANMGVDMLANKIAQESEYIVYMGTMSLLIFSVRALWIKIKKAADIDGSDQRVKVVSIKPIKPVLSVKDTFLNVKPPSDLTMKQTSFNQGADILEKAHNPVNIMSHQADQISTSIITITAMNKEERLQTKKEIERLLRGH